MIDEENAKLKRENALLRMTLYDNHFRAALNAIIVVNDKNQSVKERVSEAFEYADEAIKQYDLKL